MTPPSIIVPRPEPGAAATADQLRTMGLTPIVMPLFEVVPVDWDAPDPARFDALALSSANAVRHGGLGLDALKSLPVYAVGEATKRVAAQAGFHVAATGIGGISGLEVPLRDDGRSRILRLVGSDHMDFTPDGMTVATIAVYESRERALPSEELAVLSRVRAGSITLLYSVRAARAFANLIDGAGLARMNHAIVALAPAIMAAAGDGWRRTGHAETPDEASLLSALQNMLEADASTGSQDP